MTQPTPYRRGYDFSDAGGAQPPGGPLDGELNNLALTTSQILRNMALLQRDDTGLRNGIVGIDALDSRVLGLISGGTFSIAGTWETATSYPVGAFLTDDGAIYLVMEAHTSTSIVDDLAAGRIAKALQNEQGSRLRDDFIGNAVQTAFSLSQSPARPTDVEVYVDGVLVPADEYVQTGATVTFLVAPANGVEISIFSITWATAPPIQTLVDAVGDRNLEISAATQFLDEVGIGGAALVDELAARPTTAALASSSGGEMVGFQAAPTLPLVDVDIALKSLGLTPEIAGTAKDVAANVSAFSAFLTAQPRPIETETRTATTPRLHCVSEIQNGKNFQGFPSAVRHDGTDYIIYREGLGHVETVPFGTKARLVCAVRDTSSSIIQSRTVIYSPTNIDPRDPNVLRDDHGNAILVGGKFKVVNFEWAGNYNPGSATAKVWDLDPAIMSVPGPAYDDTAAGLAVTTDGQLFKVKVGGSAGTVSAYLNVAGVAVVQGLANSVTLPAPVIAVKSDVRQLSTGDYAFVGYDATNVCHLVTTSDWATFATEEIGPGNEAAFCETDDGDLNVIVRAEECFADKNKVTIFYKRALAGGAWRIFDVLPFTINAPTLVKSTGYVTTSEAGANEGWLLFARDKTGRAELTNNVVPVSDLVCFRSRQDYGRTITRFENRIVIAGIPRGSTASDGDCHYASVIAGTYDGNFDIYTYGEFNAAFDSAGTSFKVGVWRISGWLDQNLGVLAEHPAGLNYIQNPSFRQGSAGYRFGHANAALVTDSVSGETILRVTDTLGGSSVEMYADVPTGATLFPKMRMRVTSTNLASGRHVLMNIYDASGGAPALIRTVTPEMPLDKFDGQWRNVVGPPIVATSTKILCTLSINAGITAAVTDIACIELSDDYTTNLARKQPVPPVIATASLTFITTSGGANSSATFSAAIWDAFGFKRKASQLPFPCRTVADVSLRLSEAKTQAGALRCVVNDVIVNGDGTVTAYFSVAPGESGTMGTSVTCKGTAMISAGSWPFA